MSAQLLTALAGEIARPERRGCVIGTIAAGSLSGILLSRTVSEILADLLDWRAIYAFVGVLTSSLAIVLHTNMPVLARRQQVSYLRLPPSFQKFVTCP